MFKGKGAFRPLRDPCNNAIVKDYLAAELKSRDSVVDILDAAAQFLRTETGK